jgi:hypothetical protein
MAAGVARSVVVTFRSCLSIHHMLTFMLSSGLSVNNLLVTPVLGDSCGSRPLLAIAPVPSVTRADAPASRVECSAMMPDAEMKNALWGTTDALSTGCDCHDERPPIEIIADQAESRQPPLQKVGGAWRP